MTDGPGARAGPRACRWRRAAWSPTSPSPPSRRRPAAARRLGLCRPRLRRRCAGVGVGACSVGPGPGPEVHAARWNRQGNPLPGAAAVGAVCLPSAEPEGRAGRAGGIVGRYPSGVAGGRNAGRSCGTTFGQAAVRALCMSSLEIYAHHEAPHTHAHTHTHTFTHFRHTHANTRPHIRKAPAALRREEGYPSGARAVGSYNGRTLPYGRNIGAGRLPGLGHMWKASREAQEDSPLNNAQASRLCSRGSL